MPACCKCNRSGYCRNCKCSKEGHPCSDCLPSRLHNCHNTKRLSDTSSTAASSLTIQDSSSNVTSDSSSSKTTKDTTQALSQEVSPCPSSPVATALNRNQVHAGAFDFSWGEVDGANAFQAISSAYEEIVHWRRNIFQIPSGKTGKSFVAEVARLFQAYADKSLLECIALKAAFTCQVLLLQKPFKHSKSSDHVKHLERRLLLWSNGDFQSLLDEGKKIQQRLPQPTNQENPDHIARVFSRLMLLGKVREANNFITRKSSNGTLKLDEQVPVTFANGETNMKSTLEILKDKHPQGINPPEAILLPKDDSASISAENYIFESLDASSIRDCALHTFGSAGPSGLDATIWKRMCTSFKSASNNLCASLAAVGRRLCTSQVDPIELSALVACRLIPFNKCPGVRPIGIGEVPRRIISKAVLHLIAQDIKKAAGPLQTCAGQEAGAEAAVHAIHDILNLPEIEGALLVDASNAFNSLNRQAALHNISVLCPSLSMILQNTYNAPIRLFITGHCEISSSEGTTQGDPLGMAMYAIGILPLIQKLHNQCPSTKQVWFADDATAAATCEYLRQWWDILLQEGPKYGYFPNAEKTHLVIKEEYFDIAKEAFMGSNINITTHGKRHLGAAIGTNTFVEEFVSVKVHEWEEELQTLSMIATTYPQEALAAFTHGFSSKWTYLSRTIPNISHLLKPLEKVIHCQFIPALTGRPPCSENERLLLSQPARLGGLGITKPDFESDHCYEASKCITAPLASLIKSQDVDGSVDESKIDDAKKKTEEYKDKSTKSPFNRHPEGVRSCQTQIV